MSWSRWKAGLIVALLSGLFTGVIGLAVNMDGRQILIVLLVNVAKDGLLFLTNHPVDSIDNGPGPGPKSTP